MDLNFVNRIAGTILLVGSLGCAIPAQNGVSHSNSLTTAPTAIFVSYNSKTKRPPTKSATIYIEGEKIPITVKLYNKFIDILPALKGRRFWSQTAIAGWRQSNIT